MNTGESGGFNKGIEITLKNQSDYIWIMDDDVLPETDCLELLIDAMIYDIGSAVPNRTDDNFTDMVVTNLDMKSALKFSLPRRTLIRHPLEKEFL